MACIAIWFDISSTCGGVWSNWVEQNRETDEERDDYCVAKELQLSTQKSDREWEALGMGNCSIKIWDGSELELAWSKKKVH